MANEQVQKLYDEAFQLWQEKNTDRARELIDEALRLAPDDLSLHALAMHVKKEFNTFAHVPHAEFILDHDVNFRDTLDESQDPFGYADLLLTSYSMMGFREKDDDDADTQLVDVARRYCRYAEMILRAGREIDDLPRYVHALYGLERYDEVIDIGKVFIGLKSAAELGLPGLELCDELDQMGDDPTETILNACHITNRNEEALEYCRAKREMEPNQWRWHQLLGEAYCRLNRPEEAARQLIVAIQKGGHLDYLPGELNTLCDLVADPQAATKTALRARMYEVKDKIPADHKAIADRISLDAFIAIGDPKKQLLQDAYVEAKIGTKLPVFELRHLSSLNGLWLPRTQGPHPFVKSRPQPRDEAAVTPRTATAKPMTIERFGIDLTALALSGQMPPIVGRDREIDALIRILIRMEKNNPVLIGEAGVGKTAIAQGLAQRIAARDVPACLQNRRVFELTMASLVGGTMWRGDFEQRMTHIIREAHDNPEIILFVDELHTIMGAGATGRGDLDAANMVKPALAKGEIRLIGATTTREYAARIERDQAMARRFTPVRVTEMNRAATLDVLRRRREHWLKSHHVQIPDDVLNTAVEWSDTYVPHRKLPDKAIDLLDESCAYVRTRMGGQQETAGTLALADVRRVLMEWTGAAGQAIELPTESVHSEQQAVVVPARDTIVQHIRQRLVGQDAAVETLCDLVAQLRLSLKDPSVPLALVFYGLAGTGKTTAAHALAGVLWPDDPDRLLTLNLADYADAWSLQGLIGTPLGYAQHEQGGLLSARLNRQPHSILLLKNSHAAHPQVLTFFSDLLRHGGYWDAYGRPVSARDAVLILHVNASAQETKIGFDIARPNTAAEDRADLFEKLERTGLPDRFLQAVTHVLPFSPHTRETIARILRLRLDGLEKTFAQKETPLRFGEHLLAQLTQQFLKLPADRRNFDTLLDHHLTPLIRTALLATTATATQPVIIDAL